MDNYIIRSFEDRAVHDVLHPGALHHKHLLRIRSYPLIELRKESRMAGSLNTGCRLFDVGIIDRIIPYRNTVESVFFTQRKHPVQICIHHSNETVLSGRCIGLIHGFGDFRF